MSVAVVATTPRADFGRIATNDRGRQSFYHSFAPPFNETNGRLVRHLPREDFPGRDDRRERTRREDVDGGEPRRIARADVLRARLFHHRRVARRAVVVLLHARHKAEAHRAHDRGRVRAHNLRFRSIRRQSSSSSSRPRRPSRSNPRLRASRSRVARVVDRRTMFSVDPSDQSARTRTSRFAACRRRDPPSKVSPKSRLVGKIRVSYRDPIVRRVRGVVAHLCDARRALDGGDVGDGGLGGHDLRALRDGGVHGDEF